MEKVIEVLNRMQADGVFEKFAIGGRIAAIYYLEPYQTDGGVIKCESRHESCQNRER